jgi:hypothetical protein
MLLIPLDFVPGVLQEPDARAFALCVLTCEALVALAVRVAGRPGLN